MHLLETALLLMITSKTFAASAMNCPLGANTCDSSNSIVMVCGARSWSVAEICQDDACRLGPRGTAYCEKEVECIPGRSECDATNYSSRFCNEQGFWETEFKCSKPGCCEVQNDRATCKTECGPGLPPPARSSSRKLPITDLKAEDCFASIGKGF